MNKDPLEQLLSDDFKAEDRERLATLLLNYIIFDKESKQVHFKDTFHNLDNNSDKMELVFLTEKARALLFENGKNEGLGQSDIIAFDILPIGSVKTTLKKLFDTGKIKKNQQGKYFLPSYRLNELFAKYSTKESETNGK